MVENETNEEIEQKLTTLAEKLDVKLNGIFMPIRVAVTGSLISPPLLDSIRLLGLEKTVTRLEGAIKLLEDEVNNG